MVRKLYLTPPAIPEGLACRTLKIPADKYWLGIFNNALLTTLDAWRYEQVNDTDLTIDETIAKCNEILIEYWLVSECNVCTQPNGMPFIRIGEGGQVEQLGETGWESPTGDYTVPEVPARTGGTPQDQMCLAAANATNVLKILYETISDAWNGGLTNAETLSELLLAIAAIIAAAVALWAAAIIALVIVVWDIIYDTLEYVLADLWDANVDDALRCILYDCANNAGGVVTFDYDCVINQLAANTDPFGNLTFDQLRLFGQLVYILSFIGGDGLNLAGATTAITSAECDDCACEDDEILTVPATNGTGVNTSFSTRTGWTYKVIASGTFFYNTGNNQAGDAQWYSGASSNWTTPARDGTHGLARNGVRLPNIAYNGAHEYEWIVNGTGGVMNLRVLDNPYTDNAGSLTVRVMCFERIP